MQFLRMGVVAQWKLGLVLLSAAGALVAGGAAAAGTPAETSTFAFEVLDPCTGETLSCEGHLTTKGQVFTDNSGGEHTNIHGVFTGQCVGLTSGARYTYHSVALDSQLLHLPTDGANTLTVMINQRIQRQGEDVPGDDFIVTLLVHGTLNNNGELTADVVHPQTQECR